MINTTYTKLNSGEWGLRGHGLAAGSTVTVTKRDGSTKTETVGRILWTGADGLALATIASAPRRATRGEPRGKRRCYMCGSYYCEGARGGLCEED